MKIIQAPSFNERARKVTKTWLEQTVDGTPELEQLIAHELSMTAQLERSLTMDLLQRILNELTNIRTTTTGVRKQATDILHKTLMDLQDEVKNRPLDPGIFKR